ncbi:acyltransferase [Mucilaginibacter roseus]|uniref:Acyltransferase n=1 Tax=Mucilaginibacter roseus TaxID=1528868 RepID=A0ABS8U1B1_9SPHI|nr:acyltransferase [Mucilaginibacter roseus]MCD8739848.1 acyltransferase [Mucilaginibacter roseus]
MNVTLTNTKQHFKILDGLRGMAAISVVIFHFMEITIPDYKDSFIAHAYLAVDFFFCLSGFVIAYAYDHRLNKIGIKNFLKLRLIRLHPLVLVGSVIGLLAFMFDPFSNLYGKYQNSTLTLFLSSLLMIPYPLVHERYYNLFHLNPPTWSLFWEYISNVCYAFFLVKIRNKLLWTLTLFAAGMLIFEAQRSGNLAVGWGGDNIFGGSIRVFFSFLAGILVYRSGWIIHTRLSFLLVGMLLLIIFLIPFSDFNRVIDPLVVIVCLPLLVSLGAGARLPKSLNKLCNFSGDLSYPLYMIHYPFVWVFMSYVEKLKPSLYEQTIVIMLSTLLLILLAYIVLKVVDIPIRLWLKERLFKKVNVINY